MITENFTGTGALSGNWVVTTVSGGATHQRISNKLAVNPTGTSVAMYGAATFAADESITINGLAGLNHGVQTAYIRADATTPGSINAYLGQLLYSAGNVQYRALTVVAGVETTELFYITDAAYSDGNNYTFYAAGSTVGWKLNGVAVAGASATDTLYSGSGGNTKMGVGAYDGVGDAILVDQIQLSGEVGGGLTGSLVGGTLTGTLA